MNQKEFMYYLKYDYTRGPADTLHYVSILHHHHMSPLDPSIQF
jgi:hypothetical protein